jgi:hypothetical protein
MELLGPCRDQDKFGGTDLPNNDAPIDFFGALSFSWGCWSMSRRIIQNGGEIDTVRNKILTLTIYC